MKSITNVTINHSLTYLLPLPNDYEKLEYIESDGSSYIDTGVIATSNMSCDLKFEFVEIPSDGCLIGTKRDGGNRLYFYHYFQGHRLGYGNYLGSGTANINTQYRVQTILNQNHQELKINDSIIYTGNNSTYINNKLNYYLFDLNSNKTDVDKYKIKAKLYYCKIWRDDNLIRNFVPVKNIKTLEIGLFDLVEQKFYNNLGTGTFK